MFKKISLTKQLTLSGLMIALSVLLDQFANIDIHLGGMAILKVGLAQAPILFLSIILGPLWGGVGSVAGDIIRTLFRGLVPNPLFSISAFLYGFLCAIFTYNQWIKSKTNIKIRIFFSAYLAQFITSILINTSILYLMFNQSILILLVPRLLAFLVEPALLSLCSMLLINILLKSKFIY